MSRIHSAAQDVDVDLGALFAGLMRRWPRILIATLVLTGVAIAFAWTATPKYRAETRILIETRESVFTRPDANSEAARSILDEEGVTSQVEVVSSTEILKQVARQLDLAKRAEFDPASHMGMLSHVLVAAGLKSDPSEVPVEERVLKVVREQLSVYRVEKSRVIVIGFSSADPKLAAEIPNAIADAYIKVQQQAKLASNSDATDWLAPEISDLTRRVREAEAKVASYRSSSGLLMGQNNTVLVSQQLSEMSSELSRVRAERAAAEAKAQSIKSALDAGGSLEALPEVLSSGLVQRLSERRAQVAAEMAQLSTTLLPNHPRLKALGSQRADLDRQVRAEAQKVLAGLRTEAATAKLHEDRLVADLDRIKAASSRAGEQEVELRALEREATAQRQLLESYLTRYREASSRMDRSYLPVDARIFSRATAPAEPYFPKRLPIVLAALTASLLLMAVLTLLQELFSGRAMRPAAGGPFDPVAAVAMPGRADPLQPLSVAAVAGRLRQSAVARAVFLSPEGEEAAATSVLVARELADGGLRVLLLDLTPSGAASRAMLDSTSYPGITNLLAAEAQFTDVIHPDLYSDCHVLPAGTAEPERAMRAADRLPIILNALTSAYDLIVIECGRPDAAQLRRTVSPDAEILVSMIDRDREAVDAAEALLRASGYGVFVRVTPAGHAAEVPAAGRSAA